MHAITERNSDQLQPLHRELSHIAVEKVFKIPDLFALISLGANPHASLSLSCVNKKLIDLTKKEFSYINKCFNELLGVNSSSADSLKICLERHQQHFNEVSETVKMLSAKRGMALDEEIDQLRWNDLSILKERIIASDKLVIWQNLADRIVSEGPSTANFSTVKGCIEEADKFSSWFNENINLLSLVRVHSLSNNQLTQIPSDICQLTQLQQLSLDNNKLAMLPSEIGQLTQLQQLHLSHNQLKTVPSEIGQLTQLKKLFLGGNQLIVLPSEIGQLTQLNWLYLADNKLAALPSDLGQIAQLQQLCLNGNHLKMLPTEIGQLTQLQQLYLNGNELKTLPSEIGQLSHLQQISLSGNQLKTLPSEIGQIATLRRLIFAGNQLTALPSEIDQLKLKGCFVIG